MPSSAFETERSDDKPAPTPDRACPRHPVGLVRQRGVSCIRGVLASPGLETQSTAQDAFSNLLCQLGSWPASNLQRACRGLLGARACRPPAANARRQRFADIRVTLNHRATSRRARSSAVSPPPSGCFIPPTRRGPRQPSRPPVIRTLRDPLELKASRAQGGAPSCNQDCFRGSSASITAYTGESGKG